VKYSHILTHPDKNKKVLAPSAKNMFFVRLKPVHVTLIHSHSQCRTEHPVRSTPQDYTAFCFFCQVTRAGSYCAARSLLPPHLLSQIQVCTDKDEPELNQKMEVSPWPYVSRNGAFAKEKIFSGEENSLIYSLNWKLCYDKTARRIT